MHIILFFNNKSLEGAFFKNNWPLRYYYNIFLPLIRYIKLINTIICNSTDSHTVIELETNGIIF